MEVDTFYSVRPREQFSLKLVLLVSLPSRLLVCVTNIDLEQHCKLHQTEFCVRVDEMEYGGLTCLNVVQVLQKYNRISSRITATTVPLITQLFSTGIIHTIDGLCVNSVHYTQA